MDSLALFRIWLGAGWILVLLVVFLSLAPLSPSDPTFENSDKLVHLAVYCGLMTWFAELYRGRSRLIYAIGFVAMGVVLEFVQGMTGYRSFDVMDMGANFLGVTVGWCLAQTKFFGFLGRIEQMVFERLPR